MRCWAATSAIEKQKRQQGEGVIQHAYDVSELSGIIPMRAILQCRSIDYRRIPHGHGSQIVTCSVVSLNVRAQSL